jgi:competence protein ComEC
MPAVGLLPALGLLAGAAAGTLTELRPGLPLAVLAAAALVAPCVWNRRSPIAILVVVVTGFAAAGVALAADARERALRPRLRALLDREFGGFAIESLGPEADHDPLPVRGVLLEDAAVRDGFVSLRMRVRQGTLSGQVHGVEGDVSLTVSGRTAPPLAREWRAGRTVEVPVTFRRPARYLNEGVPDFERQLALDGTALFASAKSALLVRVVAQGDWIEEAAAAARAHVRGSISRWVGRHDLVAAGIVTAVLIGDRTGLPDELRDRLQAAGTYHVIAISGGNIAVLAGLGFGLFMLVGVQGRMAAVGAIGLLLVYAQIATAGPSVWRATVMAVLYLTARLIDHRTPAWQATSAAAAVMVVAQPLDVRDPGFVLTFGATAALVEGARRGQRLVTSQRLLAWILASVGASLAAEIALLPISAQMFSRVTAAGLVLNLIAVPMMGIAQVAGIVVTIFASVEAVANIAGWIAYAAATAIIDSARLVVVAPWLTARVPPPGLAVVGAYYLALLLTLYSGARWIRFGAACALALLLLVVVSGSPAVHRQPASHAGLRLTLFDVGQGEAMLLEAGHQSLQIDAGGAPFGSGAFDIGARVLAPALWARGVPGLESLLLTHGDPDHISGARVLLDEFAVRRLWEGIVVPRHQPTRFLRAAALGHGATVEQRRAGESLRVGAARVRVLHPPAPDWERPRVRNDDSVVLEVTYGRVALLLTGDVSADVEQSIVPQLTPAPLRVLKVAHHGSRTSTSQVLLDSWPPHIALISAGRGNTFGHPTLEVLRRLESAGTRIYRTDLDGQITLTTDGREIEVTTYVGGQP